ncbi:MAG: fold metallo-hydrolase [Devosia sp.]|uniref:MBL fold metallo-hydrolase n=1 Tax=Devosia sp. TaxID=1871048 RepID=UPI002637F70C|nr:MBL fold metallo-hydrolase [Devosia sp.]MDB5528430.1 fold metallo-hydrolase [Devosia sp.]
MPRQSTRLSFAALALASITLATAPSFAAGPLQTTSAPGYYRIMVGAYEVTALSDGTVDLPVDQLLTNITPDAVKADLAASFETTPLETSDNAFLINTGDKLILVDSGAGGLFGPTLGKLLSNLEASGYRPGQVDEVLLTHLHPDHVGGLVAEGKAAFPNATVYAAKADADYWLSQANLDAAPDEQKGFFQGAIASLQPYVDAGRLQTFEGSAEIAPGVHSMALPGHTAGHSGYLVESEGQSLLIWGDVVHVEAIQFAHPDVTIGFDSDAGEAAGERAKAFADVVEHGYLVAGAHLSFPGLGHVRKQGDAYQWVPANYSVMR